MEAAGMERTRLAFARTDDTRGRVRLALSGEIDLTTVEDLRRTVEATISEPGVAQLDLDLARLTFIDSRGTLALIETWQLAESRRMSFRIVNATGTVLRVLKVLGVHRTLAATSQDRRRKDRHTFRYL
jgi:anti-anti-sigma factor